MPNNQLSWSNFIETLAIMAFISFAIGLYWRFKFRSRYWAVELEESRLLNEQLKEVQLKMEERAKTAEAAIAANAFTEPGILAETYLAPSVITLTGTTNESVTLQIADLLYIEAVGNYVKIYHMQNDNVRTDMLRATSRQMEDDLRAYPMIVRCHRAFLVNLGQVGQIVSKSGSMQLFIKHCHDSIPVSRSNMSQVKEVIKAISTEAN